MTASELADAREVLVTVVGKNNVSQEYVLRRDKKLEKSSKDDAIFFHRHYGKVKDLNGGDVEFCLIFKMAAIYEGDERTGC